MAAIVVVVGVVQTTAVKAAQPQASLLQHLTIVSPLKRTSALISHLRHAQTLASKAKTARVVIAIVVVVVAIAAKTAQMFGLSH